jgi:hypothetical protein
MYVPLACAISYRQSSADSTPRAVGNPPMRHCTCMRLSNLLPTSCRHGTMPISGPSNAPQTEPAHPTHAQLRYVSPAFYPTLSQCASDTCFLFPTPAHRYACSQCTLHASTVRVSRSARAPGRLQSRLQATFSSEGATIGLGKWVVASGPRSALFIGARTLSSTSGTL